MSNDKDQEIVATCEAAVTRLTDKGRITGKYADDDGRACLAGAIALSQVGRDRWIAIDEVVDALECPAIVAVATTIVERQNDDPWFADPRRAAGTIVSFNDAPGRTDADVIDVLTETIKRHTSEVIDP